MSTLSHASARRAWLYALVLLLWLFFQSALVAAINDQDYVVYFPTTERRITNHQLEDQTTVANYIAVAGLTLYIWEYLCTLSHELYMWFHPRLLLRPHVLLFLAIRYATIPAIVVPLYSMWGNIKTQEDCPKHEQITVAVVQFVVACIFSWRTIAIWRRRRWVVVFLVTFTVLLFLASLGLLYFSRDAYLVTGECRPALFTDDDNDHDDKRYAVNTVQWFYLTCIIFDTVILVLSTYKLFVYANMGRTVNTIAFRDPFGAHRQQMEKTAAAKEAPRDVEAALHVDPAERRTSGAGMLLRGLRSSVFTVFLFPYRKASALYSWWFSLTPLVARLLRNGVLYFVVATAYSVNNFVLEAVQSLHSKSFLTLYAPLMCVMCQRMLLTEFQAVWSPYDEDSMIPGRELVAAVTGNHHYPQGHSDIDRFEYFASNLEERHASVVSPRSHHDPAPWHRRTTSSYSPDAPPNPGADPPSSETAVPLYAPPVECEDGDLSSHSGKPSDQTRESETDQARRDVARRMSPSSGVVPLVPPQAARHRVFQLSPAQREQALRMAGL